MAVPDRKPLTQHGFLELPVTRDLSETRVDIAILGVPYDLATTGRSGTREGPLGVRRASWQNKLGGAPLAVAVCAR
jgi:arginase family enzyme